MACLTFINLGQHSFKTEFNVFYYKKKSYELRGIFLQTINQKYFTKKILI